MHTMLYKSHYTIPPHHPPHARMSQTDPSNLVKRIVSQIRRHIRHGLSTKALQLMKRHKYILSVRAYRQIVDTILKTMAKLVEFDNTSHDLILYIFYESPHKDVMDPNTQFAGYSYLFELVCYGGSTKTVRMLLDDDRIDPIREGKSLVGAARQGRADVVRLLLQSTRIQHIPSTYFIHQMFDMACRGDRTEIVELILNEPRLDHCVGSNGSQALIEVSELGHTSIVRLLLDDVRVDPAYKNNAALNAAASYGRYDIVQMLISHPAVDPYVQMDHFIKDPVLVFAACKYGWVDLLKQIILDEKFMSIDMNQVPIITACERGQIEVVKLCLELRHTSKFFDPTYASFTPLIRACNNGHLDILKLLLAAVEPNLPKDAEAIRRIFVLFFDAACRYGSYDMVRYLLADSRVEPAESCSGAIMTIACFNRIDILKLLLEDGRINIFAESQTISFCITKNFVEIIDLAFDKKINFERLAKLSARDYWQFIKTAEDYCYYHISSVIKRCRDEMDEALSLLRS